MNSAEAVRYSKDSGVVWVTLSRPRVHNAIDLRIRDDLWEAVRASQDDPDVRVVVFEGASESFSSGADITDFGTAPSYVAARKVRQDRDLWGLLAYFPKPLIAAIHGYVLGAGLELAMFCDFRLCADDAHLGLPETKLAYMPAAGGSQLLPRLIGPGRALELIFTGSHIEAQEALRLDLVHLVTSRQQLHADAEALAKRIASLPSSALRAAKQAVVRGLDMPLDEGLALERRLATLVLAGGGNDDREG